MIISITSKTRLSVEKCESGDIRIIDQALPREEGDWVNTNYRTIDPADARCLAITLLHLTGDAGRLLKKYRWES